MLLIGPGNVADAARGAGYTVLSEQRLDTLQQSLVRVRVRDNETIEQAINTLRQRVPDVRAAPNHVFRPMGNSPVAAAPMGKFADVPAAVAAPSSLAAARIGIIDTGADTTLAPLHGMVQATHGFASGGYAPLRARPRRWRSWPPSQGAGVAVGDVFGVDSKQRLVAPADSIAAAIDWLLSGNPARDQHQHRGAAQRSAGIRDRRRAGAWHGDCRGGGQRRPGCAAWVSGGVSRRDRGDGAG